MIGRPDLEALMALHSPELLPVHRGRLHPSMTKRLPDKEFVKLMLKDLVDWVLSYDGGEGSDPVQERDISSLTEMGTIFNAMMKNRDPSYNESRFIRDNLPTDLFDRFLNDPRIRGEVGELLPLDEKELGRAWSDAAMGYHTSRKDSERARHFRRVWLIWLYSVASDKPLDSSAMRSVWNRLGSHLGLTWEEQGLLESVSKMKLTFHRLDDYETRHRALDYFRDQYRSFLGTPLDQRLSEELIRQHDFLANVILNRGKNRLPVRIEDIDRIAGEFPRPAPTDGRTRAIEEDPDFQSGAEFLALRPRDLADTGTPSSTRFWRLRVGDIAFYNFLTSLVDEIVVVPDKSLDEKDRLGFALPLFKTVFVPRSAFEKEGDLLFHLAYLSGQIHWYRHFFNGEENKLGCAAARDRWALVFAQKTLEAYEDDVSRFGGRPETSPAFVESVDPRTRRLNEYLGLDPEEDSLHYWYRDWDGLDADFFRLPPQP